MPRHARKTPLVTSAAAILAVTALLIARAGDPEPPGTTMKTLPEVRPGTSIRAAGIRRTGLATRRSRGRQTLARDRCMPINDSSP